MRRQFASKGEAVQRIRDALSVGEDTVAFIDDQPFECEEVKTRNPLVRLYSHEQCLSLLERKEFEVTVTKESRARRAFYKTDEIRRKAVAQHSGEYIEFLKRSNIVITVTAPSEDDFERIHEIVQRTNQMNFSGTKYTRDGLREVLADPGLDFFLISAQDNYGSYGCVGFCVVNRKPAPLVLDLMFSCRIQSKRVEHAFLISLMERYAASGSSRIVVRYRESDRNKLLGQVFTDLDFDIDDRKGHEFYYAHDLTGKLPENPVVAVNFSIELTTPSFPMDLSS